MSYVLRSRSIYIMCLPVIAPMTNSDVTSSRTDIIDISACPGKCQNCPRNPSRRHQCWKLWRIIHTLLFPRCKVGLCNTRAQTWTTRLRPVQSDAKDSWRQT